MRIKTHVRVIPSWCIALLPILMFGCATTYKADPKLNSKYSAVAVAADQSNIYVIRGSNFLGGGRRIWVGLNDKAVASLGNSSYVLLKVKSGINTVNIVQDIAAISFVPVDNRAGETVFLSFDYAHGSLKEIPENLGMSMVMSTKHEEPLAETRQNTGYDDGILNPGMLGLEIMNTAPSEKMQADASSAVITFVRTGDVVKVPFSIWNESDFVGNIKGESLIQTRVTPGHHVFIARSERYAVLNADVAAGKNYVVKFEVDQGWKEGHVKLIPLDAVTAADPKIQALLTSSSYYSVNKQALQKPEVKTRIDAGNNYLSDVRKKIGAGRLPSRTLTADQSL